MEEVITINVEPLIAVDNETGALTMSYPLIKTDGSIRVEPHAINLSKEDLAQRIKVAEIVTEEKE